MSRADIVAAAAADMHGQLDLVTDKATLAPEELRSIPKWWHDLITAAPSDAVQLAVAQWNAELTPPLLPRFLGVLTERGIDVALVRVTAIDHTGLALLYSVRYSGDDARYVCGLPPATTLPEAATKLPASFQDFYTTIHAGMHLTLQGRHAIIKPDALKTWDEWTFGEDITFLDKPPQYIPSADKLYVVYNHNNAAMALVDTDPADPGVWGAEVGMLYDQSNQFGSTWELLDDWLSGWFTPCR